MVAAQMSSLLLQKMYEFSSVVLEKLGERCGLKMTNQPTVWANYRLAGEYALISSTSAQVLVR